MKYPSHILNKQFIIPILFLSFYWEMIKLLKLSLFNLSKVLLENLKCIRVVSLFSWIKKEIIYIKDSFIEIIQGIILVALTSSGLVFALLLRYLGYNGTIITFFGLISEFIALILCYFVFRKFIKSEEKTDLSSQKEKKI